MDTQGLDEKDGMEAVNSLEVLHAIGGHIERVKSSSESFFKGEIGEEWDKKNATCLDFVHQVESKFKRKVRLHNYFSDGLEKQQDSVPSFFSSYMEEDVGFLDLSRKIIGRISEAASSKSGTSLSDAYIVIVHYKTSGDEDDAGRVLLVLLDKKGVFNFNDNYVPLGREAIDLDALKQASLLDLTLFGSVYPNTSGQASYLQFIRGTQRSDFFRDALQCGEFQDNDVSVKEAFVAFEDFAKQNKLSIKEISKVQAKLEEKLEYYAKKKKPFGVQDLSFWVDEELPDQHKAKGKFSDFVNQNNYKVNDWTVPTNTSLSKAVSIEIQGDNKSYYCKVNKAALGKKVKVSDDYNYIMIPMTDSQRQEVRERLEEVSGSGS